MNIAITVWGNRVSPVFDAARTLLIARIEDKKVKSKTYRAFHPDDIQELVDLLNRQQVFTLICGAISTEPGDRIIENQIRLIPFITGNAMDILNAYATQNAIDPTHMMPGCHPDNTRQPPA